MMIKVSAYVFLDVEKNEKGCISSWRAIQTDSNFKPIKTYKKETEEDMGFDEWCGNPYSIKFICWNTEDFFSLLGELQKNKWKNKNFLKMIKYQYWNLQNEIIYRTKSLFKGGSVEMALLMYGTKVPEKAKGEWVNIYQLMNLVNHFMFDEVKNKLLFQGKAFPQAISLPLLLRDGYTVSFKYELETNYIRMELKKDEKSYLVHGKDEKECFENCVGILR